MPGGTAGGTGRGGGLNGGGAAAIFVVFLSKKMKRITPAVTELQVLLLLSGDGAAAAEGRSRWPLLLVPGDRAAGGYWQQWLLLSS